MSSDDFINSYSCPTCLLCSSSGNVIYKELGDRLFGVSGSWNLKKCSNPRCNLIWLDPMPTKGDISKAYKNYYTHHTEGVKKTWLNQLSDRAVNAYISQFYGYSNKSTGFYDKLLAFFILMHPGRKVDADFSVMWQKNISNCSLLEVGSGSGALLKRMANLGWHVEGVDFDPKAVEVAKALGLKVQLGSLEDQSYSDNSFDVVFMSHVIEHVHDPESLVRRCFDLVQDGGQLVILTPNSRSLGHRIFRSCWMPLDPPRHLHLFNMKVLKEMALNAGFKEIKVRTIVRDANGAFIGSRNIKKFGKHDMSTLYPLISRVSGRLFQLFEWLLNLFIKDVGEEVLLIAKK